MGIVWETYHKRVPLLEVSENSTAVLQTMRFYSDDYQVSSLSTGGPGRRRVNKSMLDFGEEIDGKGGGNFLYNLAKLPIIQRLHVSESIEVSCHLASWDLLI